MSLLIMELPGKPLKSSPKKYVSSHPGLPFAQSLLNDTRVTLLAQVNDFILTQAGKTEKDLLTVEEVAMGFNRVANEAMCRPIRALTQVSSCLCLGLSFLRQFILVTGICCRPRGMTPVVMCWPASVGLVGSMPALLHALLEWRWSLSISKFGVSNSSRRDIKWCFFLCCRYGSILSAYGMALADVVHEAQEPCAATYTPGMCSMFLEVTATYPSTFYHHSLSGITYNPNCAQNLGSQLIPWTCL